MRQGEILKKEPLLSFAIPTWNRGKYIKSTIDSIINQIVQQKIGIEIFVSDNDSKDDTHEILKHYSNKYNFFRYKINEQNLGFDLNLINAIENSKGKYVWTFSDDDLLGEGGLDKILGLIKRFSPNYIITSFSEFIEKDSKARELICIRGVKKYKGVKSDITDLDFKRLLSIVLDDSGFVSVNVFKKEVLKLNEIRSNYKKVKAWSHLWMVGQATINGGGILSPYEVVKKRVYNSPTEYSVFTKQLPESLDIIFRYLDVDKSFQGKFFTELSHKYLSLWPMLVISVQLKIENKGIDINNFSKLIFRKSTIVYTRYLFPIIPKFIIVLPTKIIRLIHGKGFTLFDPIKRSF